MARTADLRRGLAELVSRRPYLPGVAAAVVLALATAVDELVDVSTIELKAQDVHDARWWSVGALMVVGLLVQHRWPVPALALAGAAVHQFYPNIKVRPLDLAVPIILYALASRARARWISMTALGVLLAGTYACSLIQQRRLNGPVDPAKFGGVEVFNDKVTDTPAQSLLLAPAFSAAFSALAILVAAFALGDSVRSRRAHLKTLEARAADLEREQQQRVALATAAERSRITREMHDVVAHGLSVIVMQAQGGAAALRDHPEQTAEALDNVIGTGRAAMADMRSMLGLMRSEPRLAPPPGVGELPALVDRVRAAGTPVSLTIDGPPVPLPASVDLSAYRIAQEALTNTIKHAGAGASATVRLAFGSNALEIEVSDDGVGATGAPAGDGNGLRGIGERVTVLGGHLTAGPAQAGGYLVRAVLPLRPSEAPA